MSEIKLKILSDDYDISVDNMIPSQEVDNKDFMLVDSVFYSLKEEDFINMKTLDNDNGWQIFTMKDGTFIVEVEDFFSGDIQYYVSDSIDEVLTAYDNK